MINCEVKLDLSCSKECIIPEISITPRVTVLDVAALQITGAIFQINNAKCSVPVVNLSFNDNIKFLENLKKGFKRTISWNKYISKQKQTKSKTKKNNNLDYLIDATFRNINRLFVLSFKYDNDDPTRDYFGERYIPLVEMNDFNELFDSNSFFDQKVKNKQDVYGKLHCQGKMIIQQEVH